MGNWTVSGHFVPRSFRTILVTVTSYPLLFSFVSFRNKFSHFVPSLVISYLHLYFYLKLFWSFRTHFFSISYPRHFVHSHFVPSLVISYPGHFVPRYEITWVRIDLFFIQTRYKIILCCILKEFEQESKSSNLIYFT